MGGYGIVGGNLPIAAGLALSSEFKGEDAVTVCMFGDGASNTGNFGETMNLAALWRLPILFLVENNLYGMGTSVERHSAQTDLSKKAEGYGIPGTRIDGMDVMAVREAVAEGMRHGPRGAPADPAGGLHLPLPRPLRRRPRGLPRARGGRGVAREGPDRDLRPALRRGRGAGRARGAAGARRRRASRSSRRSSSPRPRPEPALDTMYESLYALDRPGRLVRGRRAQPRAAPRRARGDKMPAAARELAEAGAAYAERRRGGRAAQPGDPRRRAGRRDRARPPEEDGTEPQDQGERPSTPRRPRADGRAADARGAARRDGRGDAPRRGGLRDGRGRRRLPAAPSR